MNCLAQHKNKRPAWDDEDEEKDIDQSTEHVEYEDDDDDLDMFASDVRSKKLKLETRDLSYKFVKNINDERSYKGGIQQVHFHPKSKVCLVTLGYGQADLFEVDGERNKYIQNIVLPKTKTPFCSFDPQGESIVISSESYRGNFFTYNMVTADIQKYAIKIGRDAKEITDFVISEEHMACRKEGSQDIIGLSSKTFENTFSVRLNEPARAIHFTKKNEMIVAGENARVYIWDLRKTSLCKHRFTDEGSVHLTSLALSEISNQLSIGSDSGVVNSYELDSCLRNKFPQPIKSFTNLKSSIDILKYNSRGELLIMGSKTDQKAFRLIHSLSGTVYKNFPPAEKQFHHLLSADFSPMSGYLGLGCSNGRALLCRIPYYKSY